MNEITIPPSLIRKGQLAAFLCVTTRTIDNWMKAKHIPYIKMKRVVLFNPDNVVKALQKFEQKASKR